MIGLLTRCPKHSLPLTHIWHHENRFSRNGHYKPILTRHGGVRPTKA